MEVQCVYMYMCMCMYGRSCNAYICIVGFQTFLQYVCMYAYVHDVQAYMTMTTHQMLEPICMFICMYAV